MVFYEVLQNVEWSVLVTDYRVYLYSSFKIRKMTHHYFLFFVCRKKRGFCDLYVME